MRYPGICTGIVANPQILRIKNKTSNNIIISFNVLNSQVWHLYPYMFKNWITIFVLIIALGETVVAAPAIRPNWNHTDQINVNLSGITLSYNLPKNLSADFPVKNASNKNLYDSSLYQGQEGFVLAEYVWDYKTKTLWTQDILGSLQLRISVFQSEQTLTSDMPMLQEAVTKVMTNTYAALGMADSIRIENQTSIKINKTDWLSYRLLVGRSNQPSINYAALLDDKHFVQFSFTIIESKSRDKHSWYQATEADISRIMDSVSIAFPN